MTVIIAIPPKMGVIQADIGFRTLVCRCGGDVCSWFVGELFAAPLHWGLCDVGLVRVVPGSGRGGGADREPDVESGGRDLEQRAEEHLGSLCQSDWPRRQERVLSSNGQVVNMYHWSISEVGLEAREHNECLGRFWSTRMTEGVSYV